jgi:phosphoribosylformylglycinamidine synthase
MPRFDVEVRVMPRAALLDPQGQAVEHALQALGFDRVSSVRIGRAVTLHLERPDPSQAEADARSMCQRLLANPVTEDFTLTVRPAR